MNTAKVPITEAKRVIRAAVLNYAAKRNVTPSGRKYHIYIRPDGTVLAKEQKLRSGEVIYITDLDDTKETSLTKAARVLAGYVNRVIEIAAPSLQEQLDEAVACEEYEVAAKLRDKINAKK